jgi:hypothetical protein
LSTPHPQVPSARQLSVRIGSQATHAEPRAPQVVNARGLQSLPEQHPEAQLAAVQPEQIPPSQVDGEQF